MGGCLKDNHKLMGNSHLAPAVIGSLTFGFLGLQRRICQTWMCFTLYSYQWPGLFMLTGQNY